MAADKTKSVIKKTLLGGFVVLLPIGIMIYIGKWLIGIIQSQIQPITNLLIKNNGLPEIIGDLIALALLTAICFLVGLLIHTGAGKWFHNKFDSMLTRVAPGYRLIREIVDQFLGGDDTSPFVNGEVCLVQLYGKDIPVKVTALITARSKEYGVVYLMTAPNPTSGIAYHVPWDLIELRPDVPIDSALRTVVSCGSGTPQLFGWETDIKKADESEESFEPTLTEK